MPGALTVKAYRGDAKTLLAFNLAQRDARNLAGFTIECRPPGQAPYYLYNTLRYEDSQLHAQDASESPNSSLNSPFHKFRWLHVPGSLHQGLEPAYGSYDYVVTPRYCDDSKALLPLDGGLSAEVDVEVAPFTSDLLQLAFTRGYTQSQGFVNNFGPRARIRPPGHDLIYDTSQVAGVNAKGVQYTYADEYRWLGFTAREKVFGLVREVLADPGLRLDMFAYDLNEPDLVSMLLELARQGRIRAILDDAGLHHSAKDPKPEDQFERLFRAAARAPAEIKRGRFGRYAHDKVLIISDGGGARRVLTGSTNFSVTGLYVNSNHVLVFDDAAVAAEYRALFETVWQDEVKLGAYRRSRFAGETFSADGADAPRMSITFAPHTQQFAGEILGAISARIAKEGRRGGKTGSVLFAVMAIDKGTSPVYDALKAVHADQRIFSYGVSDDPGGIALYEPRRKTGVLVTGKPVRTQLPPPFNQVPGVGRGHQIHHKFVVCGFNSDDAVVYCGSSNLACGGEERNGDNLLEIHDREVVTAFAVEAVGLVDHFQFLDREARGPAKKPRTAPPPASKMHAAAGKGWFLSTGDGWVGKYFRRDDLYRVDREMFA